LITSIPGATDSRADFAVGAHGFPPALTRFVGRTDDLDKLARLLCTHRLITVIGPGGVGKTRLAAEVTGFASDRFTNRVWLVELAATSAPAEVFSVLGARLGVQQQSGRSTVQAVADLLSGAPTLLVLDNCEQLVETIAEICTELLARCDDLVILATSREPLGVAGEARLRLRPLATRPADGDRTQEADGIALFTDRARLTDPSFQLSGDAAGLVQQIVARVDGLPLAIELAAGRVESMGLRQLYTRLTEPLQVLTGGTRTMPARHRSLWATVAWSYGLLSEPQQRVFRRLAVLPGPFTLRTAEAVGGADAESVVWHLVDCSLLTPPRAGADGRTRYLMLQTVRAFALEQLDDSGERENAAAALVTCAVQVASTAAAGIRTAGGEAAAAARLDAEEALLREAMSYALERDGAAALRLGAALAPWWQLRGRALTGYPVLDRALKGYPDRDDAWRAAHKWLGRLAHSTAEYERALMNFDALCADIPLNSPSPDLVDGLAGKSGSLRNLGRLAEADDAARSALQAARHLHYAEGEANALTQLSLVAEYGDDAETAAGWARQAMQIDGARLPDRAARRVRLILTLALADSDELDAAREICAAGLESARSAGDVTMQADFLSYTTHIALRAEQLDDAGAHIVESLQLTAQSGDSIRILDCLDECARLCAATGRPAEAVTLWAARAAGAATLGTPSLAQDTRYREKPLLRASRRLGPPAARAAERRGAQMNLQTAAEFAAMLADSSAVETDEAAGPSRLTPRERELLVLVAQGRTDAQIAHELFISIRTVRSHLDRIRDKTGSRRRADLTMLALRAGVV
jgi:non-specific serine/threonine protein kinase